MVGKMARKSTMRRVRQGKRRPRESGRPRETGFLGTWDVDSSDAATAARLRRFVYGDTSVHGGKVYRRPGSRNEMVYDTWASPSSSSGHLCWETSKPS